MKPVALKVRRRPMTRRALGMVEAAVSVLIVGIMMTAVLNTVGAAKLGQYKTGDRGRGQLLALALMSEILGQSYEEPVETPVFGREASESAVSRAAYDDVDDYQSWSASPPQDKDGTQIPGWIGWSRGVTVEYASADNLTNTVGIDQEVKLVTVTVKHNNIVVASLVAVRTSAIDALSQRN